VKQNKIGLSASCSGPEIIRRVTTGRRDLQLN